MEPCDFEIINNNFLQLETVLHTDFPSLCEQSFDTSREFFSSVIQDSNLIHQPPSKFEKRVSTIQRTIDSLDGLLKQFRNTFNEFQTQILNLALSPIRLSQLENKIEDQIMQILKIQIDSLKQEDLLLPTVFESPFLKYEKFLEKTELISTLLNVSILLHMLSPNDFARSFAQRFAVSLSLYNVSEPNLSKTTMKYLRWIAINKLLIQLHSLKDEFDKMKKQQNEKEMWIYPAELEFISKKLNLIGQIIFNEFEESSSGLCVDTISFIDSLIH